MKQNTTVDTKDLVTTIAYLIGVRKNVLEQCFMESSQDLLQSLYASQSATIIRYLCKLRTTLFCTFKKTDDEMRYNLKNLTSLEWKRARYVGGIGTRQDSVKLSYDVQIFRGDPSLSNEENFKGEPIYSRTTEELRDSIPWETINGDVNIGDYLILRVKPTSVNTQSAE